MKRFQEPACGEKIAAVILIVIIVVALVMIWRN